MLITNLFYSQGIQPKLTHKERNSVVHFQIKQLGELRSEEERVA